MNPLSPEEFFVAHVAAEVRAMPITEARTFLRGLLALVGPDTNVEPLREVYRHIDSADDQLELIASGQLKLNLGGDAQ